MSNYLASWTDFGTRVSAQNSNYSDFFLVAFVENATIDIL